MVKVVRASGLPVDKDKLDSYKNEWKELVDKVELKCRVVQEESKTAKLDILRMQALLARLEKILARKYTLIDEWSSNLSNKEWRKRLDEYGNIMIASARDSEDIVYVIMDDQEVL